MANHKSAKKCIRQIKKKTIINRNRISRVRTFVKKAESVLVAGNSASVDTSKENALSAFTLAQKELMKGVSRGIIHKNTAARKISRLYKRLKALVSKA